MWYLSIGSALLVCGNICIFSKTSATGSQRSMGRNHSGILQMSSICLSVSSTWSQSEGIISSSFLVSLNSLWSLLHSWMTHASQNSAKNTLEKRSENRDLCNATLQILVSVVKVQSTGLFHTRKTFGVCISFPTFTSEQKYHWQTLDPCDIPLYVMWCDFRFKLHHHWGTIVYNSQNKRVFHTSPNVRE